MDSNGSGPVDPPVSLRDRAELLPVDPPEMFRYS